MEYLYTYIGVVEHGLNVGKYPHCCPLYIWNIHGSNSFGQQSLFPAVSECQALTLKVSVPDDQDKHQLGMWIPRAPGPSPQVRWLDPPGTHPCPIFETEVVGTLGDIRTYGTLGCV